MRVIRWHEKHPGRWVAQADGCHRELASVARRVSGDGWVLHMFAQGDDRRPIIYRNAITAMRHAQRWLQPRLDRLAPRD